MCRYPDDFYNQLKYDLQQSSRGRYCTCSEQKCIYSRDLICQNCELYGWDCSYPKGDSKGANRDNHPNQFDIDGTVPIEYLGLHSYPIQRQSLGKRKRGSEPEPQSLARHSRVQTPIPPMPDKMESDLHTYPRPSRDGTGVQIEEKTNARLWKRNACRVCYTKRRYDFTSSSDDTCTSCLMNYQDRISEPITTACRTCHITDASVFASFSDDTCTLCLAQGANPTPHLTTYHASLTSQDATHMTSTTSSVLESGLDPHTSTSDAMFTGVNGRSVIET